MYEAIAFDMDGVLLRRHPECPEPYREVVVGAFEQFDVTPADDEVAAFRGADKSIDEMRAVCERHDLDLEAVWRERERRSTALQRRMVERGDRGPFDDADVLADLADDHRLAVVSNNQAATVGFVLEHLGLEEHVDAAHGREPTLDGLRHCKPEPRYLERALADLAADAERALFVGDAAADVRAAHRAGADSAFLRRDAGTATPSALPEQPDHVLGSLRELPALLDN